LGNTKKVVAKFEERMNAKVRQQENLNRAEERDFRRGEITRKI